MALQLRLYMYLSLSHDLARPIRYCEAETMVTGEELCSCLM